MRIVRAGTKCANHSVPTFEHVSQSYSLVLLEPLLKVLKNIAGEGVNFFFTSDSTCSLRLLKEDVRTTNKLASYSKIQIEQMLLLSTMFPKGDVRAVWCPSELNLSDSITRASNNPVAVGNSELYRIGKLPTGECMTDLINTLVDNNTFVKCKSGSIESTPEDDAALIDCGYYDRARRKAQ